MKTTAQKIDAINQELARLKLIGVNLPDRGGCEIEGYHVVWNMPAGSPTDPEGIAAHTIRTKLMQALAGYDQELKLTLLSLERKARLENNQDPC
jgi:hypothetical protein